VRKEKCPDGDVGKQVGGTRTVDGEHHCKDMIRAGRERSKVLPRLLLFREREADCTIEEGRAREREEN
jgi:hypothetical protein